ncbi:hypothetical protein BH11PSE9_BH11PSE9_04510 [soil metagenome]
MATRSITSAKTAVKKAVTPKAATKAATKKVAVKKTAPKKAAATPRPAAAAPSSAPAKAPGMGDLNIGKLLKQLKLPGIDVNAMVESQRKDIEALAEVSRHARESMETLASRQAEMLKEAMAAFQSAVKEGDTSAAGRVEQAKDALGTALANMRELAEMTVQAHQQAYAILKERVQERIVKVTGRG